MLTKIIGFFKKEKPAPQEPRMTKDFISPKVPSLGPRVKHIHVHHHYHNENKK